MLDLTTRNDAKRRAATCRYTEGVDGINTRTPQLWVPQMTVDPRPKTPGTPVVVECSAQSSSEIDSFCLGHVGAALPLVLLNLRSSSTSFIGSASADGVERKGEFISWLRGQREGAP